MLRFLTKYAPHISVALLVLFAIVSLRLAWTDALTFDELAHIPASYSYVAHGDFRLNPEHPPVLKVLAGLPLLALHPTFDLTQDWWTTADANGEYGQWAAGRHLLHEAGNDTDALTFAARVPMVLVAVFFGALLFAWGRRLGGALGGLLVVTLFVFSPTILGHDHFVTTDIGIAAAVALAFYALFTYIKAPSWKHALLAGAALGFAQVVKFSAVMLVPFFVALVVIYPLVRTRTAQHPPRSVMLWRSVSRALVSSIVSVIVVWAVYVPFTVAMPTDVLDTIAPIKFAANDARNTFFRDATLALNTSDLTRPFAMYLQGLGQVFNRVDGGNGAYFFGEVSGQAFPLYFPTVFTIKETLPHIALILVALSIMVLSMTRCARGTDNPHKLSLLARMQHHITTHITEISLLGFIVFYAYISITGNLNIGLRHLMPIIPLIYLLTGVTIARALKNVRDCVHCKRLPIAALILFGLMIFETVRVYPYYMSYFNPSVGGPMHGYNFVTDSNADWGQDGKRLALFLDQHPEIGKIRVDYFGGDNMADRLGDLYIQWWDSKRPLETGWYAVSVNYRQGSIYSEDKTPEDSYQFLLNETPRYQVGTSILIYFIDTEPDPDIAE